MLVNLLVKAIASNDCHTGPTAYSHSVPRPLPTHCFVKCVRELGGTEG